MFKPTPNPPLFTVNPHQNTEALLVNASETCLPSMPSPATWPSTWTHPSAQSCSGSSKWQNSGSYWWIEHWSKFRLLQWLKTWSFPKRDLSFPFWDAQHHDQHSATLTGFDAQQCIQRAEAENARGEWHDTDPAP